MKPRWPVLLTLATWTLAASASALPAVSRAAEREPCELSRVHRATTPSRTCMACHDGSAGQGIGFQMRPGGHGMSHPVAVEYGLAAAARPGQYQPAGALPVEVPLVRGRVECTSCHDGASKDPKRVVAVRDLCLACHRL